MLCGLYARGGAGWLLGFVALVPWLRTLAGERSLAGTLLSAWAMSIAFTAAVFAWFGSAIGAYAQLGAATGLALLLLAAPLFQPQFLAFALVRHLARRRHGPAQGGAHGALLGALAGAAAWVAAEWLLPRLLGDTLGHGLYPSRLLRQAADVGGATGLTVLLLLANEAFAVALSRRGDGLRALAPPLALALLGPLVLAGYGLAALADLQASPAPAAKPLRMGLVQSNIHDYDRLRAEKGAGAVVREVLDTHFAMSYDAVERQHADAVLWSETVYPTTFGRPKSEAGAELDAEIQAIVNAAGVPFVFGTYERDAEGEYNAAAFVSPGTGLFGFYRKTRLFPLTEHLPAWLDGPAVRRWLPWAGAWRPGSGARVFPLRLADGREIPVLPLICLDDVDAGLAIDGARLGAQVILTMSNDAWFTEQAQGAALHQAVAAFRSVETRLPQFRVTTTGYSAAIDNTGSVIAATRRGERALLIGDLPVREPPPTLMVAWGDWVGRTAAILLALLAAAAAGRRWARAAPRESPVGETAPLPAELALLPRTARFVAGLLRVFSRGALFWMLGELLLGDGTLQSRPLALIRSFVALSLIPEVAAWCVLRAFAARVAVAGGTLVLSRGRQRLALQVGDIAAVEPWRVPIPCHGAWLRLRSGGRWRYGLAGVDPWALMSALVREVVPAGGAPLPQIAPSRASAYARARLSAPRGRLARGPAKFVLLPLLLAIPAFRLHQHIAYGSALGEYLSFGPVAYLTTFVLWWAAWVIGVVLCAAVLRAAIEAVALAAVLLRPERALEVRRWLERGGLVALYLGVPLWLLLRLVAD